MIGVKTVLLTGVTGQIGSAMAPLLQKMGYRVLYLIREKKGETAQARLRNILETYREGMDIAIRGDVTEKCGGLSEEQIALWIGQVDVIFHGAAAISFEDAEAEKTKLTNLQGTRNMLDLAEELCVTDFHYVSTAYISGSARVFWETDLDVGQSSFNAYEVSKIEAEKMVRDWKGGKYSIHRLSTVLGDSRTGQVMTFHSYYGFFTPFYNLLRTFQKKWETDPDGCRENGVTVSSEGKIDLPLYIDCSETAVLNLTTCDWVAQSLVNLLALPSSGQTYHLVNSNPPRVKWVIEVSLAYLGITGVRYDHEAENSSKLIMRLQSGVDRAINKYRQYIKHGTDFKSQNLKRDLGDQYVPSPTIDEELLHTMLAYAVSKHFGREGK